ncbi:hypothetical protein HYV31_00005, partial [candidate division WWE3 bacterium]|nr:hypothetical protein [candidate division WWE3 bacterium]
MSVQNQQPAQNSSIHVLNTTAAASILKVSPTTLRRLEIQGKITSTRDINNYRIFNLDEITNLKLQLDGERQQSKIKYNLEQQLKVQTSELKDSKPNTSILSISKKIHAKNLGLGLSKLTDNLAITKKVLVGAILITLSTFLALNSSKNLQLHASNLQNTNNLIKRIQANLMYLSPFDSKNNPVQQSETKFGFLNSSQLARVLGDRDKKSDFVFKINVPANLKALNVEGDLTTNTIALVGTGTLSGVAGIDTTTITTFATNLNLSGDIIGNLVTTSIADGVITGDNFSSDVTYDGTFDITG